MGLPIGMRKAVTEEMVKRYRRASKGEKGLILDELCALTGWDPGSRPSGYASGRSAWEPNRPRRPRPPVYGPEVDEPLRKVWAGYGWPCGKRLAPFMTEAVQVLKRHGEIEITV